MDGSTTLAEAERAALTAQYSEAAMAEIAGLKKERDFLTLEVDTWKRLAGVRVGDLTGEKRSQREVVDELRDIAYGLCQSPGKTCIKESTPTTCTKQCSLVISYPKSGS